VYRILVGIAEGERLIRGSGKNRREILKWISEECVCLIFIGSVSRKNNTTYEDGRDCSETLA